MATIKVVRTRVVRHDGVCDITVQYRAGARLLAEVTYPVADSPEALAAWENEIVRPQAAALAEQADPLVGDWLTLDTDTGEDVPTVEGIPAERAAQYAAIKALWELVGGKDAKLPADYPTAFALVDAWVKAAETDTAKINRLTVALTLATMRAAMTEAGCTWSEALAWEAQQP